MVHKILQCILQLPRVCTIWEFNLSYQFCHLIKSRVRERFIKQHRWMQYSDTYRKFLIPWFCCRQQPFAGNCCLHFNILCYDEDSKFTPTSVPTHPSTLSHIPQDCNYLTMFIFITQRLNSKAVADGWSYFYCKCPCLHLHKTTFSFSAVNSYCPVCVIQVKIINVFWHFRRRCSLYKQPPQTNSGTL